MVWAWPFSLIHCATESFGVSYYHWFTVHQMAWVGPFSWLNVREWWQELDLQVWKKSNDFLLCQKMRWFQLLLLRLCPTFLLLCLAPFCSNSLLFHQCQSIPFYYTSLSSILNSTVTPALPSFLLLLHQCQTFLFFMPHFLLSTIAPITFFIFFLPHPYLFFFNL